MNTFNNTPYYKVNREERHFGFLFMAAMVCSKSTRTALFQYINKTVGSKLDAENPNIYAEVSLFRDYWNNLGDAEEYSQCTHDARMNIFKAMLDVMNIPQNVLETEDVFWTGKPGSSKLYYPGKWTKEKIVKAEDRLSLKNRELWRLRWSCNAKPDVLVEDNKEMVFIEIKVESGFGQGNEGYSQEETQEDIIAIGKRIIPTMGSKQVFLSSLTQNGSGLIWNEIVKILQLSENDGLDPQMIVNHLNHMPK